MTTATRPCRVSVVIKALNEEANIAAAIETCLVALRDVGGEVILADSCSTDGTVREASRYPVRIVQLARQSDRSCGAGPQLGYQHSQGEYVYIMDGDMKMVPGFLEQALTFLAQHPEIAGVGGRVVELNQEANIATAIDSCLHAQEDDGREEILADSVSTDGTDAQASRYPLRIVQL
ncbi:MAG: glycosyltransferase, partial [Ramlibacter sp.]